MRFLPHVSQVWDATIKEADAVKLWTWMKVKQFNESRHSPAKFAQLTKKVINTKIRTRLHFAKQRGGKYIITLFPQFE